MTKGTKIIVFATIMLPVIGYIVADGLKRSVAPPLTTQILTSDLLLTEKQTEDLKRVLDETSQAEDALKKEGLIRIQALLTPPQSERFAAIQKGQEAKRINSPIPAWAIMLACAEMFWLILRSRELTILLKSERQRTPQEQFCFDRGLPRSVVLEAVFFVPASVMLVFVTVEPVVMAIPSVGLSHSDQLKSAAMGMLGIISYGFPFLTIKRIVTSIAINTLKELASAGLHAPDSQQGMPEI